MMNEKYNYEIVPKNIIGWFCSNDINQYNKRLDKGDTK